MFIKLQDDIWIVWFTEIERAQSRFNRRHVAKVFWYLNSKRNIPFWFGNFLLTYGNLDICANWGKARKLERVADVVRVGRNAVLRKKSIQFEMKHTKRVWEVHPRFECLCSKLQPVVGTLVNLVFTAFSGLVVTSRCQGLFPPHHQTRNGPGNEVDCIDNFIVTRTWTGT